MIILFACSDDNTTASCY